MAKNHPPGHRPVEERGPEIQPPAASIAPQTVNADLVQETPADEVDEAFQTAHPVHPSAVDPNPPPIQPELPPRPVAGVDQVPKPDPVYDPAYNAVHPNPGHNTFPARGPVEDIAAKSVRHHSEK